MSYGAFKLGNEITKVCQITWFLRKTNHKTKCCCVKYRRRVCGCLEKHSKGKRRKNLRTVYNLLTTKIRHFLQTFVVLKLFLPLDRSSICFEDGGLLLALLTSHEMLLCWSMVGQELQTPLLLFGPLDFLTLCCTTAEDEGLPGGSLFPCSLLKLPYAPMFPNVFLICSPFNKFAYHLSPPLIPFRKKKKKKKKKNNNNKKT